MLAAIFVSLVLADRAAALWALPWPAVRTARSPSGHFEVVLPAGGTRVEVALWRLSGEERALVYRRWIDNPHAWDVAVSDCGQVAIRSAGRRMGWVVRISPSGDHVQEPITDGL